ncbi:hypothetical protein J3F83DRAFT_24737 [Trichoderma novae-zelandiae]
MMPRPARLSKCRWLGTRSQGLTTKMSVRMGRAAQHQTNDSESSRSTSYLLCIDACTCTAPCASQCRLQPRYSYSVLAPPCRPRPVLAYSVPGTRDQRPTAERRIVGASSSRLLAGFFVCAALVREAMGIRTWTHFASPAQAPRWPCAGDATRRPVIHQPVRQVLTGSWPVHVSECACMYVTVPIKCENLGLASVGAKRAA